MAEYSFFERISKIFGLVTSSTFFISLIIVVILTVGMVIINYKVKNKVPRLFAAIGYLIIIVFVILKYGMAIYNMQDSFTNKVFSSLYFPNLITYLCILLISLFIIIIDFIDKNKTLIFKIISVFSFGVITSLFVIILDVVKKNEIDISSAKSVYENADLMILIQASTSIFAIWVIIEMIDVISRKLSGGMEKNKLNNNVKNSVALNTNNISNSNNKQNISNMNYKNKPSNQDFTNKGISDFNNYQRVNYLNNYYNNNNKSAASYNYYGINKNNQNNNSTDNLVSYINDIYNIPKNTSNEKVSDDKNYHQVNYLGSSGDNYDK